VNRAEHRPKANIVKSCKSAAPKLRSVAGAVLCKGNIICLFETK
jgi:hypothetical protein